MKVKIDYGTYTKEEEWLYSDYFCPACRRKSVYEEQGGGDYYEGPSFICISCKKIFTLPTIEEIASKDDKQRLNQIRKEAK